MHKPILEINRLSKNFGGLSAISGLDFSIAENEIVGIIGPNGAGKTTVFNLVSGFLKPTSGSIIFKGREITGNSTHKIAKMGIIRTFQLNTLLMNETVESNILLGLYLHNGIRL